LSAGTGLFAIYAEREGAPLGLKELAKRRADLLGLLFPEIPVTRHDAAQIDDRAEPNVRPTVVLRNAPFSVAAHVEGKVRHAAWRHLASAFARLVDGGRLVVISGAAIAPEVSPWRETFVTPQDRGRVVFSAAVDGRV
jgi:hypothetical protein